jgi:hypothetical protein
VRWLTFAAFALAMISSLNWHRAATREQRIVFGVISIAAFGAVLVLGMTMPG